jgi:hypothetical protein
MPGEGEGAVAAVDLAARVGEVGFAQFTSDLVTNVFNALVDANSQQAAQYIGLVKTVGASLAEYVEATRDDVDPEEIAALLAALGIDLDDGVNDDEAKAINDAVELPAPAGVNESDNRVATAGDSQSIRDTISEAVARRIAANRFDFLKQMVQLGVVRVVVDHGVVETRLIFRTRGKTERGAREKTREKGKLNMGYAGLGLGFGASNVDSLGGFMFSYGGSGAYGARNDIGVKTASQYDRDVTGSRVQIYGQVEVHFKTDYQPLNS